MYQPPITSNPVLKIVKEHRATTDQNENCARRFPLSSASTPRSVALPSICLNIFQQGRADFKLDEFFTMLTAKHFTPRDVFLGSWHGYLPMEVLHNGWTRIEYPGCPNRYSDHLWMVISLNDDADVKKWWFSQQNYVPADKYHMLHLITAIKFNCTIDARPDEFTLRGTFMADSPTDKAYLFLFSPQVDLVDGHLTITNPPDPEKYYWAFDPAGLHRLTHQMAEDIGLHVVEFSIDLLRGEWDESFYDLTRDFAAAKGFNPYSQDAAISLGYPLVDSENIKKFARELARESSMDCPDAEVNDEIFYSLGLC
ncbi:hypothetical protein B0H14DRAFT_3140510 [Mycena olivaceomarginata]|nr:hypothetical protein B0H14DRAFT_3140510 [Mycena olivaceomarginata]